MRGHAKPLSAGRSHHLGRTALLALLLLGAMALSASSALALQTRLYTGTSFGPEGTAGPANFQVPQAVTVDQATGDLYVLDAGEGGKLYKFNAAGQPSNFSALTGNVIAGVGGSEGNAENEIAIAPPGSPGGTAGDIYLANNSGAFQVYGADGSKLGEVETGGETCGVAVDPAGHLFVGVFGATVLEYTPTTNPPTAADQSGAGTAEIGLCNVAADGLGNIYASNFLGGETAKLEGLTDPSPSLIEPGGAALAIDPVSNDLYLDQGSTVAYYTSAGAFIGRFGSSNLSNSHGVAIGSTAEKAYVANRGSGRVELYGPTVTLPDVTTEAADAITKDSATLHGTISADGGPAASCEFQYTTAEAFQANQAKGQGHDGFEGATSVGCSPSGPFTGSSAEAVSAPITNLNPGTDYRFRVLGANVNGSNPGAAEKLLTLGPTVLSSTATNITTTTATLTGFVDPHGKAFSYHIDYGLTASYGSSVPVPDAVAEGTPIATGNVIFGSKKIEGVVMSQGAFAVGQDIVGEGIEPGTTVTAVEGSTLTLSTFPLAGGSGVTLTSTTVFVSQPISGLAPGTEYHARLVAANADATYLGPDRSFSTYSIDTGLPDGRAYEMVSPPLKIGEAIPPEPSGRLGNSCADCLPGISDITMPMQATEGGDTLAFEGQPFAAGLAPSGNQYLSRRSGGGWAPQSITPPRASSGRDDQQSGFKAFSAGLSRGVMLQATPALSGEVPAGEGGKSFNDLYLWEAGNPSLRPLVTVKPPHRAPALPGNALETNGFELAFAGANSGEGAEPAFEHLAFEANDALTPAVPTVAPAAPEVAAGVCGGFAEGDCNLYEWVGGQLRLVNVLPGNETATTHAVIGSGRRLAVGPATHGDPAETAPNVDHAISADGSRIFWSDESGQVYVRIDGEETLEVKDPGRFLTASADGSKVLLNDGCLYSLQDEECEAQLSGTPSGFLGIAGASEDLSRIYFVSTEALAAGAVPVSCETIAAEPYEGEEREGKVPAGLGCNLYAYEEGEVTFIAALHELDNNLGLSSSYGSWKASRSNRTSQVSPDGRHLAFMSYASLSNYDNRSAGGNCHVGSSPSCFEVYEYDLATKTLACPSCNPSGMRPLGQGSLSLIRPSLGGSFPQPGNLPAEGEGRLFFESQDELTTADTNGHIQDVYEWTPDGVGSCKRAAGCIALISSGHSPVDSMFLNSTPSGNDSFFVTREQLLARDKDEFLDVYDARVNGGFAEETTPPCLGRACRGTSSSVPSLQGPGTSTFSGPPNKKHHKHKKHRKHKAKKHKAKHAHKRSPQHKKIGGSK